MVLCGFNNIACALGLLQLFTKMMSRTAALALNKCLLPLLQMLIHVIDSNLILPS